MISLPADWLSTLQGHASGIITSVMPLVLLILGIFIAILAVKFIVGLVHK